MGKDVERESVAALEADPNREPLARLAAEPEPDAVIGPRTVVYTNDAINRLSMHDGATGQTTSYTPNHLNVAVGSAQWLLAGVRFTPGPAVASLWSRYWLSMPRNVDRGRGVTSPNDCGQVLRRGA